MKKIIYLIFCCLVIVLDGAYPRFSHLSYDTGNLLAMENLNFSPTKTTMISQNCVTSIGILVEKELMEAMLDYKGMFLSVLTNPSNYDRVCQVYESALQRLLRCPKEEVEAPTGIIALLRYVCDVRHDVIKEFGECMSNVEKIFLPKCQKGCTHPEILTSSGKDNLNMSCVLVHCSTICLDRQISECGDDIRLENIYSLLSGATMLLGVESSLRNNVPTEEMMFAYNNIPRKCKKMMDDSVSTSMGIVPKK